MRRARKHQTGLHAVLALGLAAMALLAWATPGKAGAAIQLGQVSPIDLPACPLGTANLVQASAITAPYEVPSPGVITQWSHRGGSGVAGSGRAQLWRRLGSSFDYTLVGRSEVQVFTPAFVVDSFPSRIPVSPGDLLGLRTGSGCVYGSPPDQDFVGAETGSDPVPGETRTLGPAFGPFGGTLINVAAILEPDADADGFGDETQDRCPGQVGPDNGCPSQGARAPQLNLDAKRRQKAGMIKLEVGCGAVACAVRLAGLAKIPRRAGQKTAVSAPTGGGAAGPRATAAAKSRAPRLRPKRLQLAAGATRTVRLRFKRHRKAVGKIKRLLEQGGKRARRRSRVVVKATATAGAGTDRARLKIKLKR